MLALTISATAVPIPTPYFSATFTADPTRGKGRAYEWVDHDYRDSPTQQAIHQGIVVLSGDPLSYINLTAHTGAQSVELTMDDIGGLGAGSGSSLGWSFEVTFKAFTFELWAKLFDIGNGPSLDEILAGYTERSMLQFACIDQGLISSINAGNITLSHWAHMVAVLQVLPHSQPLQSQYMIYINGVLMATGTGSHPALMHRHSANLGHSNWAADPSIQVEYDTFNIYDVAVDDRQVTAMYEAAMTAPVCNNESASLIRLMKRAE